MEPFRMLSATACPLPRANVDTDQLIPARFMKRSRAEGYGDVLLHDLRLREDGTPDPDFPLNRARYKSAQVLVARRNFGAGSSREAAVYALMDAGLRCVVAPSFGDIFAANGVNNGLLPARVTEDDAEALLAILTDIDPSITVDLDNLRIVAGNRTFAFAVDPVWRTKLLNGWDDLDLTMSHADAIAAWSAKDAGDRPWGKPAR